MTYDKSQPIGIFDSGIGGLTVANAISTHLPSESLIYFGDSAHLPYGEKSADAIKYYAIRITKFLIDQGCKMIVIACNSAASTAHEVLLDFFGNRVQIVSVVDPLVDKVIEMGHKNVGIIATKATVNTHVYKQKLLEQNSKLNITELATPLLVPMIEEGFYQNDISQSIIEKYLSDPSLDNIETLLLACTHYPLIKQEIEDYYQNKVAIYDSTDVVVEKVKQHLLEHKLLNDGERKNTFYVSDYTTSFEETTRRFYKDNIELKPISIW